MRVADQMPQGRRGEVRLVTRGAAGFRASAQAIPRFSTPPARARRDLPLRARVEGATMAAYGSESGECRLR
jgi:hypothetical protein